MGVGEVIKAADLLFARINTSKSTDGKNETLDKSEISKANELGFGALFELKEGMTLSEFEYAYTDPSLYETNEKIMEFEKNERAIHVKYLQQQYGTTLEPDDNETIEDFEKRLESEMQKRQDKPTFGT